MQPENHHETSSGGQSLLPLDRAEAEYRIPTRRLNKLIRGGQLRAYGEGRTRLIERADLETYIREQPVKPKRREN